MQDLPIQGAAVTLNLMVGRWRCRSATGAPAGIRLAATFAEMQFVGRNSLASMQAHRSALDDRLAAHGRTPRDCGVLWSVRVQVADSEADALEKERRYIAGIPPEAGLIELSHMYGIDFSALRGDMPLCDVAGTVKAQNVHWGSFQELLDTNKPEMTVGELGRRNAIGETLAIRGTPASIADRIERIHEATGRSGGIILAKGLQVPAYPREFVNHVVPEPQRRGLTKKRYQGRTLRDNLN